MLQNTRLFKHRIRNLADLGGRVINGAIPSIRAVTPIPDVHTAGDRGVVVAATAAATGGADFVADERRVEHGRQGFAR